ncbi:FecR family protein [Dongia sp. agr-C8]
MKKSLKVAATVAAMSVLLRTGIAEALDVGAMEEVRQNVYGVPPQGGEAVKRKGDPVVFQETLQTLDESGALIRFIDDSKLSLGAKSKVLIDAFVFDPKNAKGNALIEISVGTLRFVTGDMPKGGVVIKTPTATLTLRGTDVLVHVHPDGTTDTTVYDGKVEAQNMVTNEVTNMLPGEGSTIGVGGTTSYDTDETPDLGTANAGGRSYDVPEHRRGDSPAPERPTTDRTAGGDAGGDDGGGDDDGGCDCI